MQRPQFQALQYRCNSDKLAVTQSIGSTDMATGWAGDGAVQDQIDATIKDAVERARRQLANGPGRKQCEECGGPIPAARRKAVPGVRFCITCQQSRDQELANAGPYNRRGSKDSQLR